MNQMQPAGQTLSPVRPRAETVVRAILAGIGSYLPRTCVSNDDLAKRVDTSDEWIRERTGIRQPISPRPMRPAP